MSKTIGCADLGYSCAYRITAGNDEEQLILDTTVRHAKNKHPEIAGNEAQLRETIRTHIKSLLDQAKFEPETDTQA